MRPHVCEVDSLVKRSVERSTEAVAAGGRGLGAKGVSPCTIILRRMTFFSNLTKTMYLKTVSDPKFTTKKQTFGSDQVRGTADFCDKG